MDKFGLPYLEAMSKAFEIVQRDAEHLQADEFKHFPMKAQVENLLKFYLTMDPDKSFHKLAAIESDKAVLKEEAQFLMKFFYAKSKISDIFQKQRMYFLDFVRNEFLMNKYQLEMDYGPMKGAWNITPITLSFADEEFRLKQENPSFCDPLPDFMKKYKNFKKEYKTDSIFGFLPTGKKYGGFVKAFLHWELKTTFERGLEVLFFGEHSVHSEISRFRVIYNSSIFPNDKRIEWFANLGIKAEDCELWSRLFDQQYAGYKQVHKLFGQIA